MGHTGRITLAGLLIGAAAGAAISYLYATDDGARRRAALAQFLDRALLDAEEARRLYSRAHEAWRRFDDERRRFAQQPGSDWTPEGVA